MLTSNKKLFILLGVIAVIFIIVVVAAMQNKQAQNRTENTNPQTQGDNTAPLSPDEVAPSKGVITMATATPEVLKEAVNVALGTSLITKDNTVVTPEGVPVKLNVMPSSTDAPKESAPLKPDQIPTGANTVALSVSTAGFVPNTFTVKEGQLINFVLTSTDSYTHVFLPDDRSLIGTALGVAGGETRAKSWNAPKKGVYTFRCDIPGHAAAGEVGKMIVE